MTETETGSLIAVSKSSVNSAFIQIVSSLFFYLFFYPLKHMEKLSLGMH